MLITRNLFSTIFTFKEPIKKIKVITGYTSGSFLSYFVLLFPNVEMEIYIGMSQQGITSENHQKYLEIVAKNQKVKIYYQYKDVDTHMKLFQVEKEEIVESYIGSANLSYSGLFIQNEIISSVTEDTSRLSEIQKERSILVTDDFSKQFVKDINSEGIEFHIEDKNVTSRSIKEIDRKVKARLYHVRKPLNDLGTKILDFSKIEKRDSVACILRLPMGFRDEMFFPKGKILTMYYRDDWFDCELSGKFHSEIWFYDDTVETIVKESIESGLDPKFKLIKLNETEYKMINFELGV